MSGLGHHPSSSSGYSNYMDGTVLLATTNTTTLVNNNNSHNNNNNNNNISSLTSGLEPMSLAVRLVWDILFLAMVLVAICGNTIVLWIISGQ